MKQWVQPSQQILFFLLFELLVLPSQAEPRAQITLIEETAQAVTLELTLPEPLIAERYLSGTLYHTLEIAGMGYTHEAGQPQLPFRGALIALPAEDSSLQLEIIEAETEMRGGLLLAPAPTFINHEQPRYLIDAKHYQADAFQPPRPVQLGLTGLLGEQPVAQIQFFPVLYHPLQQTIKWYKRLRVKVHFTPHTRSTALGQNSPAFTKLLDQVLLNQAYHHPVARPRGSARATACAPPSPALKISIAQTGLYALSYADFADLGLDMSLLDAEQIQMTHQGQPVAIYLTHEQAGMFGPDDVLYFYAQAANGAFTRNNVYWLTLNPNGGSRIKLSSGTPDPAHPAVTEFTQTLHMEENNVYWSRMPASTQRDHLFWKQLQAGQSLTIPLELNHLVQTDENATIRVMMQGKSDDYAADPDHHTQIMVNDRVVDAQQWNGQTPFLQTATVPQTELLDGGNSLTLVSFGDTEATVDIIYVNWLELDFLATMTAIDEQLPFTVSGSGDYQFTVTGFNQSDLVVLDITEPFQVEVLFDSAVLPGYQLQFSDQLRGNQHYYALSLDESLTPAHISVDIPPTRLKSSCHQVDYIIIYHNNFDVTELQALIAARDMSVMAVAVSDVYDEFNDGLVHPQAIKDFLSYAYEHYAPPRPSYVLLVGDANRDTLNELGHGLNYLPTYTFHTEEMGETPTDNWFVSVSGADPLPDMFLGRIPIRTQAELDAVVHKLRRYPQVPLDGWQRNVLFVTDNNASFEDVSERLIAQHLADYTPKRVYLGDYKGDKEAATADIIQALNTGAVVTNYTGHGSLNLWASQDIFNYQDVAALNNPDKLTFAVALNCQNGLFSYSQPFRGTTDSLAEAFLKAAGKGAIAMWAPSGLGYTNEHEVLADELFGRLFRDKETELGLLTTVSKIVAVTDYGISLDNLEMYTLFGDPGLRLRLE